MGLNGLPRNKIHVESQASTLSLHESGESRYIKVINNYNHFTDQFYGAILRLAAL